MSDELLLNFSKGIAFVGYGLRAEVVYLFLSHKTLKSMPNQDSP